MEQARALRVHRQEQGTEARIEAWSAPDPGPGELRIRAQWSGLNYKDVDDPAVVVSFPLLSEPGAL